MPRSSSALAAALLLAVGCGKAGVAPTPAGAARAATRVVVVDVSGSAKDHWAELFPAARELIEETEAGTRLAIFRYDVEIAEVYDGDSVLDGAEAGKKLKPIAQHQANARGTNLAKVFRMVGRRSSEWPAPIELNVVTDCGTELMSDAEKGEVERLAAAWKGKVRVRFHGVRVGHREEIRKIVPGCEIVER